MYSVKSKTGKTVAEGFPSRKEAKEFRDTHKTAMFVSRGEDHPKGPSKTNINSSLAGLKAKEKEEQDEEREEPNDRQE